MGGSARGIVGYSEAVVKRRLPDTIGSHMATGCTFSSQQRIRAHPVSIYTSNDLKKSFPFFLWLADWELVHPIRDLSSKKTL